MKLNFEVKNTTMGQGLVKSEEHFQLKKKIKKLPKRGSNTEKHNEKIHKQNVNFTTKLLNDDVVEYEESSSEDNTPGSERSPNWLMTINIDLGKAGIFVCHGLHKEDPDKIAKRFQK